MTTAHLWPEEPTRRNGAIESAARIEVPGREPMRLWYQLPEELELDLVAHSDHLVVGVAFLAMQLGLRMKVHGQVSPSLLRNLVEYQAAWCQMRPGLVGVDIDATLEREPDLPESRKGALVAFSGGVDSAFTAFRHVSKVGVRRPRRVAGLVMVHGFDIPLDDPAAFALARERSGRMAASLGLSLIPVVTNHRDVVGDWPHSHGAAVASCLALLGRGFNEGLIGQTFTYGEIRSIAEGVNALTDPLLSSDSFRIVPDGAAFERADKIRVLAGWSEFLHEARVCWQGPRRDRNCCVCEKCVRNILTFRALGLGLPPCFERDVEDEQIRRLRPGEEKRAAIRYGGLAALANASGSAGPWAEVLENRLASVRRERRSRILRLVRRLKSAVGRRLGADDPGVH